MKRNLTSLAILGLMAAGLAVQGQVTIPAGYALPEGAVDTTKAGFRTRVLQFDGGGNTAVVNSIAVAEAFLAGQAVGGSVRENEAWQEDATYPKDGDSIWILPVLNCNVGTDPNGVVPTVASAGRVTPDANIPGVPTLKHPVQASTNNIVAESIGYIYLTQGAHTFTVASDDGFTLDIGVAGRMGGPFQVRLGARTGTGNATTTMNIVVEATGYYMFRFVWFQGNGGAHFELAETVGGAAQLVNASENASKVYYAANVPPVPYVVATYPGVNAGNLQQMPEVWVDLAGAVDDSKVAMRFDGVEVTPTIATVGANRRVSYQVPAPLDPGSTYTVQVTFGNASGFIITHSWSFTVGAVVAIPPSYRVEGTLGAAGFVTRIQHADAVNAAGANAGLPNTTQRAEDQVRGNLINPFTLEPYPNTASLTDTTVPGVINMNVNANSGDPALAGQNGNFNRDNGYQDEGYPGLPGTTATLGVRQVENFSIEYVAFLDLPAGPVTFGVNSDDGFRVTTAPNPRDIVGALQLGVFEGGRGSSDTLFNVFVEEAGLYPVRLLHYQGGGGGNVEFFTVQPNNSRVLVNDTVAGALKAYQTVGSGFASFVTIDSLVPIPGSTASTTPTVQVKLRDGAGATVNNASIAMTFNGTPVTATPVKSGPITTISYSPGTLPIGGSHISAITFADSNGQDYSAEWSWNVAGQIRFKIFDANAPTGGSIANLLANPTFQQNNPRANYITNLFDIGSGIGDQYGTEALAYVEVATTGDYIFFLSSDDNSQLWLSTDDDPKNLRQIAVQASSNGYRTWVSGNNVAPRRSAPQSLVAGQRYFMRVLHKEGGGGDHLNVAIRPASNPGIVDGADPMSSELRSFDGIGFNVVPQSATILQGRSHTLSAQAIVAPSGELTMQWVKNGTPIPDTEFFTYGATTSYTIASAALADAGDYALRVTVGTLTQDSPVATLVVEADNEPPVLISGGFLPGSSAVGLMFSEPVNVGSATFTVAGATVTASTALEYAPSVVRIDITGTPAAGFQITANNVLDLVGNALTTATVTGQVSDLLGIDVGAPTEAGTSLSLGDGNYYVAGGGADIWGTADQMHYVYKQFTGAFDMRARVDSLVWGDEWAKATLMARESLDANSRNQAILITKNQAFPAPGETAGAGPFRNGGVNWYNHQWRHDTGAASFSLPDAQRRRPVFPSWLRLVRESTLENTLSSYTSLDGEEWTLLSQQTTDGALLPQTLFVGMAVTSHDNAAGFRRAEAVYRTFSVETFIPVAPTITTQPEPSVTVNVGETVTLSVVASGTGPLTYQWTKGGVDISGEAGAALIISNAQESDSGTYAVKVTGPGGTVTSNNSVVTVGTAPPPTLWDIVMADPALSTLKEAIELVGLDAALAGEDPLTVFAPNNAAFAALPAGVFDALVADPEQLAAVLTYHALPGTQLAADLVAGEYATLLEGSSVTVTTPEGKVMVNDATVIAADVLAVNGVAHVIDTVLIPVVGPELPAITTQPAASVSAAVGETVTLSVVASGTGPLTYQWTKGGVDISGQTGATLTISDAQESDSGTYAVKVTGPGGTVTSNNSVVTVGETPSTGYNIAWVSFHAADDAPTAAAATAGFTLAPDVGYTDLLQAAGHNVTRIVTSGTPNASALNKFDLIVISRSVPSGHYQDGNAANWNAISTPTIVMGGYVIRQNRMGYTTGSTIPDTDRPISLLVNDPVHPVFAGIDLDAANTMVNPFAGIVTFGELVQRGISVNTDPVAGGGTVLAVIATEGDPANTGMVIGEWQAGATMGNAAANVLGGHRLVFLSGSREQGITSEGAGIYDLTEDGARMLLNAVNYMAVPKTVFEAPVIADGNITLNWAGEGELETATDINGPWTPTGNTSGSFSEALGDGNKYYRINRPE